MTEKHQQRGKKRPRYKTTKTKVARTEPLNPKTPQKLLLEPTESQKDVKPKSSRRPLQKGELPRKPKRNSAHWRGAMMNGRWGVK